MLSWRVQLLYTPANFVSGFISTVVSTFI